jgi:hypothetical protein
MGVLIWVFMSRVTGLPPLLVTAGGVAIGGTAYLLIMLALRTNEIHTVLRIIKSRLDRRPGNV